MSVSLQNTRFSSGGLDTWLESLHKLVESCRAAEATTSGTLCQYKTHLAFEWLFYHWQLPVLSRMLCINVCMGSRLFRWGRVLVFNLCCWCWFSLPDSESGWEIVLTGTFSRCAFNSSQIIQAQLKQFTVLFHGHAPSFMSKTTKILMSDIISSDVTEMG